MQHQQGCQLIEFFVGFDLRFIELNAVALGKIVRFFLRIDFQSRQEHLNEIDVWHFRCNHHRQLLLNEPCGPDEIGSGPIIDSQIFRLFEKARLLKFQFQPIKIFHFAGIIKPIAISAWIDKRLVLLQ